MELSMLEHDYRQLALVSRKATASSGLTSFIWSATNAKEGENIKESSERVLLLLRGDTVIDAETMLSPIALSCQSKRPELVSQALSIVQKLIGMGDDGRVSLGEENVNEILGLLHGVETVYEESVQLKILQTCLVVLQSPRLHPKNADSICSVAVAIAFSYVDVDGNDHGDVEESHMEEYTKASSRLLEDLIALSSGSPARWLQTPSLPNQKTFSLEVLDFALLSHPRLFISLPAFEGSLSLRIVQLLQAQLQDHVDAATKSGNFEGFKAVLKCVRTLLLLYHEVAGRKCRSLVHTMLKGLQSCSSLIHRVAIAQVVRQLLDDPALVLFLFSMFDAGDRKEEIMMAIVDVMTSLAESGDGSNMDAVSQVFFSRDVSFDVDIEPSMPSGLQSTALTAISLHAVISCMQSVSLIVSHHLEEAHQAPSHGPTTSTAGNQAANGKNEDDTLERKGTEMESQVSRLSSVSSPRAFHHPHLPLGEVDRGLCESLVNTMWAPLVLSITSILKECSHEKLELELLRSLRRFTEAIGKLRLREPMTACLDSLCQIALSGVQHNNDLDTAEDTLVLRSKNFQAMKTIFEIASELANDLGPAWNMVLEAMYSLDNILMDPTVIGSADAKDMAEIDDLKRIMQGLFDSTKDMSREGAVSLLGGLRDVSLHHLPQAEMVATPKMSALYRMVDVFLANSFRAHDLWAPFLSHVLELVQDSKPSIREAAIDALGKAITGMLANLHGRDGDVAAHHARATDNVGLNAPVSAQLDAGGDEPVDKQQLQLLENMVLVALESLYNDKERDVQLGVLKVLAQVLQRNGEHLSDGWTPVLRLLASAGETSSPETVALGCESLQIVYNNYLDNMDDRNIQKCLAVAEIYGRQETDVNVSLSIISMLWNLGDMLGSRDASAGSSPSTEALLEIIYDALFKISKDARPEVRNSGSRSLFAMVAAHGSRLSADLWKTCLWEKLFPLLRYSFHMSVTSSKEEAEAALLGRSKGEQVRLVVHHSRNTEQKQWDETVVVCLAGMSRLMHSQFERMTRMPGFDDGWSELMLVVESSLAGGRKEVALSAMNLLGGLLGDAPEIRSSLTESMWQRGFRAIDVGVVAATSGGCHVPLGVRTELVNLLGSVYETNQSRFDRDRVATLQLYKWVDSFCRNPWSEDDAANPVQPVGMPPVQKSALSLLQKLRPSPDAPVWADYLQAVVNLVEPEHAIAALNSGKIPDAHEAESLPPPSLAQYRFALNAVFVERVMDHLVSLFDVAPLSARAGASPDIIYVLGRCMELRHTAYHVTLWRKAANVFLKLAPLGATAVDTISGTPDSCTGSSRIWARLSEALSKFLLGPVAADVVRNQRIGENPPAVPKAQGRGVEASQGPAPTGPRPSTGPKEAPIPVIPFLGGTKAASDAKKKRSVGRLFSRESPETASPPAPPEPEPVQTTVIDERRAVEDAELELKVLDCLTDEILTSCGSAEQDDIDALLLIIEEGMSRPAKYQIPVSAKHSNFSLVCIRKMYVLCSRGVSEHEVRNHVAKCALPRFLKRCHHVICTFSEESQYTPLGDRHEDRPKLEELICILEVLATMTLSPDVVDSILPADEPMTEYVRLMRRRPDVARRGKERTHLLFLYDALCSLITCRESRIRDMVRDVMQLAGADLGFSLHINS